MILSQPDPKTYDAAVVAGFAMTGGKHQRGTVVMRAAFDLVDDGTDTRRAVMSADPARFGIVQADEGSVIKNADGNPTGFRLTAEADIAVEKARPDIMVQGWHSGNAGGVVRVNGQTLRLRSAGSHTEGDAATHLFGWHPRTEDGRALAADPPGTPPPDPFPLAYTPLFNNAYRRSSGFSAPGGNAPLPANALVEIFQNAGASGTPYRFRLPSARFAARLRSAPRHCPDLPRHWAIAATFGLNVDTLVVTPDDHRMRLLWRGFWNWADHPPERLRGVQIFKEAA